MAGVLAAFLADDGKLAEAGWSYWGERTDTAIDTWWPTFQRPK